MLSTFKKISKGKLLSLLYVEGLNENGHRVLGIYLQMYLVALNNLSQVF